MLRSPAGRATGKEPPVLLVKWYDVTRWLLERVGSFPKNVTLVGSNCVARWAHFARRLPEPESSRNLEGFLKSYKAHGAYFLAHAILGNDVGKIAPVYDNCIGKRELYVRDAWEIGRHDVDCVAIQEDDDVNIPEGQEGAPVLELLRRRLEQ